MIRLAGLTKQYGLNPILRGIDLHVKPGEFVTLVGSNGAGKSTLLRIVATLLAPSGGTVEVGGWALPAAADKVRPHIGVVSHQSLLYNDLTAADNLRFFGRLYGLPDLEERVELALRDVGLMARARDAVGTFSRGMLQRLTIARATMHRPDVLLFDEPFTGLDQDAGAILENLLVRERETGRTVLMITHDLIRGWRLSDRIAILHRGRIDDIFQSNEITAEEFLNHYAATTRARGKAS